MVELKKQVEEIHIGKVPSTPLEVLEECNRATSEANGKIRKGEQFYTKAAEVICMIWEALLEDATIGNIRENVHKAKDKIIVVKEEMKKIPFQEKVSKMAEIKQLQQELQALHEQERTREAEVETHQLEATWLVGLIHPMQQKLQHMAQSLEAGLLEHISSD